MAPIASVTSIDEAPAGSAPIDRGVVTSADEAPATARPQPSGGGELAALHRQRPSPAASDTTARPRIGSALHDASIQRHTAGVREQRSNAVERWLGPDESAQLDIEHTDETPLAADIGEASRPLQAGYTPELPSSPTLLLSPSAAALSAHADRAPRDRPRQQRNVDSSTNLDAGEQDAAITAPRAATQATTPAVGVSHSDVSVQRIGPINAAVSVMAVAEVASRRRGVWRVGAFMAMVLIGLALIGLGLLGFGEMNDSSAEQESAANERPAQNARGRTAR